MNKLHKMVQKKEVFFLIVLGLLALFFFFFKLGAYGLLEPDEGRYSEIPREMLETGEFIVPHLNYVKYFEKPPLQYWLTAVSFTLFGYTEFAARFIPAFFGFLGVFLLYLLGRRMFNQKVAFLAALMLITSFEYFALTRILVLDMVLNFFLSLSLTLFYFGFTSRQRPEVYYMFSYIAMALGSLVKGPISLLFPLGIIFCFLLLTRNFRLLPAMRPVKGILLILLFAAPWYIMICLRDDNFFYFFFIHEHVLRFLTKVHGREGSIFYFIPILLLGFFPWIVFFPLSVFRYLKLKKWRDNDPKIIFLSVWFFLIFVFFSVSSSKLPAYIILVYFPLCLLTAKLIDEYLTRNDDLTLKKCMNVTGYLLLILLIIFPVAVHSAVIRDPDLSGAHRDGVKLIVYFVIWCAVLFTALLKNAKKYAVGVNFVMIGIIVGQIIFTLPKVESFRSARSLAQCIKKYKQDSDIVVCYKCYLQSIPFYLKERVVIVDWQGELKFGLEHSSQPGFFYKEAGALIDLLKGDLTVFCIASEQDWIFLKEGYQGELYELERICDFVLFSNKKVTAI